MGTKKKTQTMTLIQWLIQKIDTPSYRAGTLTGMMHPKVDQNLINAVGGLTTLIMQAQELERDEAFRGKFRADLRDMGRDIKKMDFSVDIMGELCRREGITDPRERQLKCMEQMRELMQAAEADWINPFYGHILERLEKGELVKNVNQNGETDLDDRAYFVCLNGVVRNREAVWKRVFSAAIFQDLPPVLDTDSSQILPSKCFEKKYQKKIFHILKDYSPLYKEGMTENELLTAHGIHSYAQTLEWKGPLWYGTEGSAVVDTSNLKYGTVLNAQTLNRAVPLKMPGVKRIMTIENKANYESMIYAEDTLYIYCHGFFSPLERRFLLHLPEIAGKDTEYLHWGDMDYGGICIFKYIQEELFPKLKPWKMGRAEFERASEMNAGAELDPEKRKKLEKLEAGALEELKQCIMEKNVEIEQEILLAEIYKKENR